MVTIIKSAVTTLYSSWKNGKDMRVDKNVTIEIETLNNKKVTKSLRFSS